jgi:hypothetical protein
LTLSPIAKVLSTISKSGARTLLMGGQACILYGAAEFSRDIDLAVLPDEKNLDKLQQALENLHAEPLLFPPLNRGALLRGHACHFRAQLPEIEGLRIDIMSVLHGCDEFSLLWKRRNEIHLPEVGTVALMSLPDLVQAKKTQRDKDWPMIRRLLEVDYLARPARPSSRQLEFWLLELRTAEFLLEICRRHSKKAAKLVSRRPLLKFALDQETNKVEGSLRAEEDAFRAADKVYWQPLREELFKMRQERRGK